MEIVVKSGVFKETTSFLQVYIVIKVVSHTKFLQQISKQQTKEIFRGVFFQILCYQTEIKVDSTPPVVFLIGTGIFHSMYKHYFRMSLLFSSYLGSHFCHYPLQVSSGFSSATIIIA